MVGKNEYGWKNERRVLGGTVPYLDVGSKYTNLHI